VPEIAWDGFVTLAAFAKDGVLHGVGDAVRGLVKKNFESFRALVASVGGGNGYMKRVEGSVSPSRAGKRGDVDADAFAGPRSLIDFGEAVSEIEAITADQRSDRSDPAAVRAIVFSPKMGAVDGSRGVEGFRELVGEAGVAGFSLEAGKVFASFEIAELVFDEDQFETYGEIFVGVGFRVKGKSRVPDALLSGRKRA